jgi:hypothetical protein
MRLFNNNALMDIHVMMNLPILEHKGCFSSSVELSCYGQPKRGLMN